MRYIDADKLIEEIKERIKAAIEWGKSAETEEIKIRAEQAVATFCEASLTAKKLSTADVRENVRGEWLPHPIKGNREWDVCSACGTGCKRREYGIHANGKKWVTEYNFLFCPNCGAEMRGDNNDRTNR